MPRTVRGLPQTERHFCRCYACGWSCWFGASDWTCWSKPVRAICGGSCCFGARSTPVRAIWTAESFPSTLSLSWLWRGALRSCLLMASSTGSGNEADSLAYTRRPLASIPGTSHFAFLLLTCASAEEQAQLEVRGDDTFKGSGRFADTCRHEISVERAGEGTEEHAQISLCLPEASRSGENQGHARDTWSNSVNVAIARREKA